jgi:magnesium chelatase family protein
VRIWGTAGDRLIEVRNEPGSGADGLLIVGLPQSRLRTTADRVRAALVSSGLLHDLPPVVVRIHPCLSAGATNELDLPIALAVLARAGVIHNVPWILANGRLGLDGQIHAIDLEMSPSIVTVVTELCGESP